MQIFTARKRSLRRLCFYTCLSVHRGEYLGRYPPRQVTPLRASTPPPGQVRPLGRYTPWAGTPPGQVQPPPEQCMLGDKGNKRAVRILLECFLVSYESDAKSAKRTNVNPAMNPSNPA